MKKIVFLLLIALCLPLAVMAQSYDDDLYYIPKKENKSHQKENTSSERSKGMVNTTRIYTTPGSNIVVQDRSGNARDVDEYNRRYDSSNNNFEMQNDTLYIKGKNRSSDLDGEWVNGFNGSQDDYEYAERLIRFRNPRFAVSISSPLYWDIVYGTNSWDWNVYTDGMYAYAFPTFPNRLWWDWRYNSLGYGWGYPYYGGYYGSWYTGWGNPWYAGASWGWGNYWGYDYYPGYWHGGGSGHWRSNKVYTNRRSVGDYYSSRRSSRSSRSSYASSGSNTRRSYSNDYQNRSTRSSRRVVGVREVGERPGVSSRTDASSSRRTTYTRPSSTRSTISLDELQRINSARSSRSRSSVNRGSSQSVRKTYSRGSSSRSTRIYSPQEKSRRSYNNNSSSRNYSPNNSSSRSYSPSRSSSRGSYSSGSSSRSSRSSSSSRSSRSSRR
ncbi:hypothetical protein [uncultured Bacteroides sp.]|uniref:hypothetical protein n=1 Tax=uncultured Bacteroides sp. TaxID=162156 RepID=UPI002AAAFF0D|nr:hypothetical protein [uncultured Bacteroides sp.]